MKKLNEPERDKLTVIATLFLVLLGAAMVGAFVLLMWNIYTAISHV